MKYVILILALMVGLPSAAYAADPVCEENCSSYSSDIACDAEMGHCIEPYAQCVSRCEQGGDVFPPQFGASGLQYPAPGTTTDFTPKCLIKKVTGWQELYRSGRYKNVTLWRCGWGHFLTFSDFSRCLGIHE